MKHLEHLTRQMDIIPIKALDQPITVIGAGAIGSFTVLCLAKMGFDRLTVYDFDRVSIENMNCQWFRFDQVGEPKVMALKNVIHSFTKTMITVHDERFISQELRGIVISAVDSMEARQVIWKRCKGNPKVKAFIDPRMSSEYALTYVMDPNDEDDQISYEKTLNSDENAIQEPCTAKATMYTATMIAGYVAKHVKDLVTGNKYARVTNWNIGNNHMANWPKKETRDGKQTTLGGF